jgi:hypothetical protein
VGGSGARPASRSAAVPDSSPASSSGCSYSFLASVARRAARRRSASSLSGRVASRSASASSSRGMTVVRLVSAGSGASASPGRPQLVDQDRERRARHDEGAEEDQGDEHRHRAVGGQRELQRPGDEPPQQPACGPQLTHPVGGPGDPGGEVPATQHAQSDQRRADADAADLDAGPIDDHQQAEPGEQHRDREARHPEQPAEHRLEEVPDRPGRGGVHAQARQHAEQDQPDPGDVLTLLTQVAPHGGAPGSGGDARRLTLAAALATALGPAPAGPAPCRRPLALVPRPFEDVRPRRRRGASAAGRARAATTGAGAPLGGGSGARGHGWLPSSRGEARHRVRPVAHLWNYMRESDDHPGPTGRSRRDRLLLPAIHTFDDMASSPTVHHRGDGGPVSSRAEAHRSCTTGRMNGRRPVSVFQ